MKSRTAVVLIVLLTAASCSEYKEGEISQASARARFYVQDHEACVEMPIDEYNSLDLCDEYETWHVEFGGLYREQISEETFESSRHAHGLHCLLKLQTFLKRRRGSSDPWEAYRTSLISWECPPEGT